MSRRGGYETAEYEDIRRDYRRNGNRSERAYDELDIELSRGNPRRSAPDFLQEDYSRPSAGQLVVHDRHEDVRSGPRSRRGDFEEETLVIRGGRPEPRLREREIERDDISSIRSRDRPRPREVEREETDITFRRREESRPKTREVEREDIRFRRGEGRPRPREVEIEHEEVRFRDGPRPRETERDEISFRHDHDNRHGRGRDVETDEVIFRHRDRSQHGRDKVVERDEVIFRHDDSHRHGRERDFERDTVITRGRERSLPPPRSRGELVAREHEEFIVRRREPTPPPREEIKDEIIIRRTEQRSPTPPPLPPPPPPPEPIVKPPIIQEVITHRRVIDHGVERARSPTPPPPPPSPPREDNLEISIRRKESRGGNRGFEEDIFYERETRERNPRNLEVEHFRSRSLSAPRRSATAPAFESDFESEADYYNRKAMERAYPGEAWNGATKDWAIVDVPPGTSRVRMDGMGGGGQEITWQRYNGVRRSKFISGDEEASTDFGMPHKHNKSKDMWTEITKDLVIKEAIEHMGYDYEETDYFFYVMEYLRYEDVLQLVEVSDEIRRKRRSRVRQIEYERQEIRERRPAWDERERFYEHDTYRRYR